MVERRGRWFTLGEARRAPYRGEAAKKVYVVIRSDVRPKIASGPNGILAAVVQYKRFKRA